MLSLKIYKSLKIPIMHEHKNKKIWKKINQLFG